MTEEEWRIAVIQLLRIIAMTDPWDDNEGYQRCYACWNDYPDHTADCTYAAAKILYNEVA